MTIIDTLKLARSLQSKGGFTQEAADATAEALNEALGSDVATKADIGRLDVTIKSEISRLDSRLNLLDGKMTLALWAIGINAAATIAMLVKHW
jgi:hypothetical protein